MTPEEIPQELVDILDKRAGKAHSRTGPVLAALAEILTRHAELRQVAAEQIVRDVKLLHYGVITRTGGYQPRCAGCGEPHPCETFRTADGFPGWPARQIAAEGEKSEVGDWVLAACGCVWRESRPAGLKLDPAQPRVCATHLASHPASLYPSPQGMATVAVTYHWQRPG